MRLFVRSAGLPATIALAAAVLAACGSPAPPQGGPLTGLPREDLVRCAGQPNRSAVRTTERGTLEFFYYTEESEWAQDERGVDPGYGATGPTASQAASPAGRACRVELALSGGKVVGSRFKSTSPGLLGRGPECERFIRRCGG